MWGEAFYRLGAMARTVVFILIGALVVYLAYDNFDTFDPGKNIVRLFLALNALWNQILNKMRSNHDIVLTH